jgi:hypothetical protein
MHGDAQNIGGYAGNRIQILDRIIERPALEQRPVDVRLRPAEQDRTAAGSGTRDGGSSERRTAATDVFNHHRSEQGLYLVRQWATNGVERSSWWERNDESDRPCWIALRRGEARQNRERGRAYAQMQELPAGTFHAALPEIQLQYLV